MYLMFDVGTTSVKTALFSWEGKLLHKATRDYRLDSPHADWYELDPDMYWTPVMDGFREVLGKSGVKASEIRSISGCSQGETFILLDENDHVAGNGELFLMPLSIDLSNALSNQDHREAYFKRVSKGPDGELLSRYGDHVDN